LDLDLDQVDEIVGKWKNDQLREEHQERQRKLDEVFLARLTAEAEKKKKLAAEQKTEAYLLQKQKRLKTEIIDLQRKTLQTQTLLQETEGELKKIQVEREAQILESNKQRNARIKRAALLEYRFPPKKGNTQLSSSQPVTGSEKTVASSSSSSQPVT
jgi:hypothetical protein